MKLITTIVRPDRVPEVKAALFRAGVTGITLEPRQPDTAVSTSGSSSIAARRSSWNSTRRSRSKWRVSSRSSSRAVQGDSPLRRTGEVGDGKIFVQPIERVIRIRTGEVDNAALTARQCRRGPTRGDQRVQGCGGAA